MSVETLIYTSLKSLVSNRVYRDVAPQTVTAMPRIVFQQIGGQPVNFYSGDAPSMKNARFQIAVWGDRRDTVMALARQVEDTLRPVLALHTTVLSAAIAVHEPETGLYGSRQDFSFWYSD